MKALGAIAFVFGLIAAVWAAFMLVFNVVVHDIFHGPAITFWQAGACVVLLGFIGLALRSVK